MRDTELRESAYATPQSTTLQTDRDAPARHTPWDKTASRPQSPAAASRRPQSVGRFESMSYRHLSLLRFSTISQLQKYIVRRRTPHTTFILVAGTALLVNLDDMVVERLPSSQSGVDCLPWRIQ